MDILVYGYMVYGYMFYGYDMDIFFSLFLLPSFNKLVSENQGLQVDQHIRNLLDTLNTFRSVRL